MTAQKPAGRNGSWTVQASVVAGVVVLIGAWIAKAPCRDGFWDDGEQYAKTCYSDIVPLFFVEKLNEGAVPYADHPVEYPVLTGWFMYVAARIAALLSTDVGTYFNITALLLAVTALVTIWAVAKLAGPRRAKQAAVMVAVAPLLLVQAYTNWDLFAVMLATLAMLTWARRKPLLTGVLLGLGTAAKLYPLLFLGPMFLLAWRTRRWRQFGITAAATVGAWLVVNLPIVLAYPEAWGRFFTLNRERVADHDALWRIVQKFVDGIDVPMLNTLSLLALLVAFAAIAVLALKAPRQPRLVQLLFLVVAAFLLINKVWSPQYSLWLLPLVVLAHPSLRMFIAWQVTEVLVWPARNYYFLGFDGSGGLPEWVFLTAVLLRDAVVIAYCILVVRDILRPGRDPIRRIDRTDPADGVFAVGDAPAPEPAGARPAGATTNATTA